MRKLVARAAARGAVLVVLVALVGGAAGSARAGGFDIPDNGTEALGRGGAFVAKADSPLALYYNIAGLARQRGTRLEIGGNLVYHDIAFTRAGAYPGDPADPRTPYAGQPYPTVHDEKRWFPAPWVGITTDFGWFEKLTFGLGVFGPPGIGTHQYGTEVQKSTNMPGKTTIAYEVKNAQGQMVPAPSRYDIASTNLLIVLPTLGVGWRPIPQLAVGGAAQLVYSNLDLMNANFTQLGPALCPAATNYDFAGCDAYGRVRASGLTARGIFSVLAHPTRWLDVGATYTMHANIEAKGKSNPLPEGGYPQDASGAYIEAADGLHAYTPPVNYASLNDSPVTFKTRLPDMVRLGGRVISRYPDGTERADLELDLTWENWSSLNQPTVCPVPLPDDHDGACIDPSLKQPVPGDIIHATDFPLGRGGNLVVVVPHNYKDTFGVRLGGAYNHRLSESSRLTGRFGLYYDSAATRLEDTHLDFNTADKFAVTAGIGYRLRGFAVNLAYAYIYSPPRDVTSSNLRAISSTVGSAFDARDPVITYNLGRYEYATQIISLNLVVNFAGFKAGPLLPN